MSAPAALELLIDGRPSGVRVRTALRWWTRAVGLLATPQLDDPSGLWIAPCNSVHTFGMRYPIDVLFLARDGAVQRVVPGLRPWRAAGCRRAHATLELRAGLAARLHLTPGRRLALDT
ncbi:MAG: DUF192 domain-containing protein [Burkholderiales bacterium]|nr:DUF192 domain-containing protein [Burkholderiales bacterium]